VRGQAGSNVTDAELTRVLPVTRPFSGDLVIAYAQDGDKEWQFVGQDFLDANKITSDELHATALVNLRKQIVKQIRVGQTRNFFGIEGSSPGVAATIALLPEFWKPLEQKFGCELLATIPGRDFVAFLPIPATGAERDKAIVRGWIMKNAAIAAFEESANHALSAHCFRIRNGEFEVREGLGEQDAECAELLASPKGEALLAECGAT
jgi:hypothetical protein